MAKTSTALKPVKAWSWATPNGKIYKGAFQSKYEAMNSAEYEWGPEGFKVFTVWVQPVNK